MKLLIIIFLLIPFRCFSSISESCLNKLPESEIIQFINEVPGSGPGNVSCDDKPNEECICFDGHNLKITKMESVSGYDAGPPIYSKKENEKDCEDRQACELLRDSLCVGLDGYEFFYAENTSSPGFNAYCAKVTGYETIPVVRKVLSVDDEKLAIQNDKDSEKESIYSALLDSKKGERIIALFRILNKKKNLSMNQRKQILGNPNIKAIIDALSAGVLDIAADLISNYQADGVMITESDKARMLEEIAK